MIQSRQNIKGALNSLPVEIHLGIIDYLDYTACTALAYTNRYFNQIVIRQSPTAREERLKFLCEVETWPIYADINYLACNQCLKLRPIHAFADRQLRGKRSRGHSESNRRFCLRCGIQKHIYLPGHVIPIVRPSPANAHGISISICSCCKFHGSESYCLAFARCESCEEVPPILHYVSNPGYQRCMHHFYCILCGRKGSIDQWEQPIWGQIDYIVREYRLYWRIDHPAMDEPS
ncbi:conserved hypothetical protein [Talaromyces stipitatus ATCC 10500]|uniref:F-box domain-containing protein n=1 Tax=Talaromyces stipitatus (strain ATCC 10500 / CBS 375.48 / QM 6759 / NRRL 1006) TaxID=441959 RepID=B8M1D4_TALSN|nr:uncharacterized protein TSTA_090690 [Talaromyces stipitatus ATCC 10500]EED21830.1 conserved hypothetical protein [Talaromyces stipitatus ATCC 10500]